MVLGIILLNRRGNRLGMNIGRTGRNNMCYKDEDGFIKCKEGFDYIPTTFHKKQFGDLTYAYPYYNYPSYGNYKNHDYYNYFKFHQKYYPYDIAQFND